MCLVSVGLTLSAQEKSPSEIKSMVTSHNYVFIPERAVPMSGSSRLLTPGFELLVSQDTIISYLPYFGRAYGFITPGEGGIDFTSTDFEYTSEKDGDKWKIRIRYNDLEDIQQMHLEVYDNGSANLSVNSTKRQAISFYGYVREKLKR